MPIKACATMPEFVSQWDRKIDKIIHSYGMGEHVEDIKQDIYEHMCTPREDGKTGLEAYDPARAHFSTYVYGLITTKVRNARAKRIREDVTMVMIDHLSDEDGDENMASWSRGKLEIQSDNAAGNMSPNERMDIYLQLNHIRDLLSRIPSRSHFFKENGELVMRDLLTLFDLIMQGMPRGEIVRFLNYSTGSVGVLFDQLRQLPELKELRDMVSESG